MSTVTCHSKTSKSNKLNKYIYTIWNRISETKLSLRNETDKLFPLDSVMLTEIAECEFLKMLVKISNVKVAVEIGVFTGYSSLAIAEGLNDDGKLYACDTNKEFTDVAEKYWKLGSVDHKIELNIMSGDDMLNNLALKNIVVDFAYVDADKSGYMNYYEKLLKLIRPGGLMVFDNTLLFGKVLDKAKDNDTATKLIQELNLILLNDTRVEINQLPLSDGVTLIRKR